MEPQNQLKVETLFPDFCFKVFSFSYVDGVGGGCYPTPKHEPTVNSGLRVATSCFC